MCKRLYVSLVFGLALAVAGCGSAEREELAKVRAELQETRAALARLQAATQGQRATGYLEELERLEALRSKNVLTKEEFDAKKRAILGRAEEQKRPSSPVAELDKQLRVVQGLYQKSTININERDQKKAQLLQQPVALTDLQRDLEAVQKLYNDGIININERDGLKQRLLNSGPAEGGK